MAMNTVEFFSQIKKRTKTTKLRMLRIRVSGIVSNGEIFFKKFERKRTFADKQDKRGKKKYKTYSELKGVEIVERYEG